LNPYAFRRRNLKTAEGDAAETIPQDSASSVSQSARDDVSSGRVLPPSAAAWEHDTVDAAFAKALTDASAAGRFDVVVQLAKELEARRLARATKAGLAARPRTRGRRKVAQ
jgi:hypothetical protein